jgi:two-component system chemotaxis response regulator CheY
LYKEKIILVVDDMQSARAVTSRYLMDLGVEKIFEACNPSEAWRLIEELNGKVDLIVTDHHMAPTTGLDLVNKLKKDERFANIPIIFATADSEKTLILDAIEAGANNYLTKPYTFSMFKEKFEKVIS